MNRRVLIGLFLFFHTSIGPLFGQIETCYEQMKNNTIERSQIIPLFFRLKEDEFDRHQISYKSPIRTAYNLAQQQIGLLADRQYYIDDIELKNLVNRVANKLTTSYSLNKEKYQFLISRNWAANASSWGQGTIEINLGLIAALSSEAELAFVMAHEMAHHELDHTFEVFQRQHAMKEQKVKNTNKWSWNSLAFEPNSESVKQMKNSSYYLNKKSRKSEQEADELALEILIAAGYDPSASWKALQNIDANHTNNEKIDLDFFKELQFKQMPLSKELFTHTADVLNSQPSIGFSTDSLDTHPEIDVRVEMLRNKSLDYNLNDSIEMGFHYYKYKAMFEVYFACLQYHQLDIALYTAIKLKNQFPDNTTSTSLVSTSLLQLYYYKRDQTNPAEFSYHYTYFMNDEQKMSNAFIKNIGADQLLALNYLFLNSKKNFIDGTHEHYKLLFDTAHLLELEELCHKIKWTYLWLMPDGIYKKSDFAYK